MLKDVRNGDGGVVPASASRVAERSADAAAIPDQRRIVVNGRGFSIDGDRVSHELIAGLALGEAPGSCTIAFRHGPAGEREGLLLPGRSVEIVDDEVFSVAVAVRS